MKNEKFNFLYLLQFGTPQRFACSIRRTGCCDRFRGLLISPDGAAEHGAFSISGIDIGIEGCRPDLFASQHFRINPSSEAIALVTVEQCCPLFFTVAYPLWLSSKSLDVTM